MNEKFERNEVFAGSIRCDKIQIKNIVRISTELSGPEL